MQGANKELQRVLGSNNDGPLYLLGRGLYEYSYFARKGRKLADM